MILVNLHSVLHASFIFIIFKRCIDFGPSNTTRDVTQPGHETKLHVSGRSIILIKCDGTHGKYAVHFVASYKHLASSSRTTPKRSKASRREPNAHLNARLENYEVSARKAWECKHFHPDMKSQSD